MRQSLDQLLQSISPERTVTEIARRVDDGQSSFTCHDGEVSDIERFQELMVRYLCHLDGALGGGRSPKPEIPVYDVARCLETLDRAYGQGGMRTAFGIAQSGNEGGLRTVLRDFADAYVRHAVEATVEPKVSDFCWDLSQADRQAIAREYVRRFGRSLPSEWLEEGGWRVAANLETLLKQHPYLAMRLRQSH